MKKRGSYPFLTLLLVLVFLISGCGTSPSEAPAPDPGADSLVEEVPETEEAEKLLVYASFYTLSDFAQKIGGDRVEVVNMVPPGMEPHHWEPTPMDIVGLESARIFLYNGVGLEHWVDQVLSALPAGERIVVETSLDIPLLEGGHSHDDDEDHDDEEEHEDEEDHEDEVGYDPHVWLNPQYAKIQMGHIKDAFIQADPDHQAYYEANYETYAQALDQLDQEFRTALDPLENREIIVSHQAFGYLCQAYGLEQVAISGLEADNEPDPARMAEIIDFAKEHQVKVIFFEELVSPKVAETIARSIGAETAVLSPLEGLNEEQEAASADYFAVMRENLEALKKALQ